MKLCVRMYVRTYVRRYIGMYVGIYTPSLSPRGDYTSGGHTVTEDSEEFTIFVFKRWVTTNARRPAVHLEVGLQTRSSMYQRRADLLLMVSWCLYLSVWRLRLHRKRKQLELSKIGCLYGTRCDINLIIGMGTRFRQRPLQGD